MPELPEAETIRRQLEREVLGRRITAARALTPRSVRRHRSCRDFAACVAGRKVTAVGRRGKAVILTLDDSRTLIIRLGMTGVIRVTPASEPRTKHTHVILSLDDGRDLRFEDVRKFGEAHVTIGTAWEQIPDLAHYGPEPLSPQFTRAYLRAGLRRRPGKIKLALMDQKFIAGLGNIYTDEALWRARVHPMRPGNSLTPPEVARLHRAIRAVLREAIARGGTSAKDETYRDVYGRPGYFRLDLAVYQRSGEPCPRCGAAIKRLPLGGRSTHFCPTCQPGARMRVKGRRGAPPRAPAGAGLGRTQRSAPTIPGARGR